MRGRFFRALEKELKQAHARYGRLVFDTFYLGGGTPSLLSEKEMSDLIALVRRHFDFKTGYEFTCEFNPGDADEAKIKTFAGLGINRVSLGTQAFQEKHLKNTGRLHTAADSYETAALLKKTGITNISFDFILGLPGQTLEEARFSLEEAIRLGASQVSLYDLEIHEKTFWGKEREKGKISTAPEELRAGFFQLAVEILSGAGYQQYEISTFAKPGFESRHNLIYWHNENYLGLGPGAFSYMRGIRSQFSLDVPQYLAKCEKGDWVPAVSEELSDEKKEIETLITGLRLREGISLDRFKVISDRLAAGLRELSGHGLLKEKNGRLFLTEKGRFMPESTFRLLIEKL